MRCAISDRRASGRCAALPVVVSIAALRDPQPAGLEIDVRPAQAQALALAQPDGKSGHTERFQSASLHGAEEHRHVLRA